MPVQLFPNWVVKLVRSPQLHTRHWLSRPVEVFRVPPAMTKFEIKEYLVKLYNMPVSHVHTAIYEGGTRTDPQTGRKRRVPDFKKAYVYLFDRFGAQKIRYHQVEAQMTDAYREAWPVLPHRVLDAGAPGSPPKKADRPDEMPIRNRNQVRSRRLPIAPYDIKAPER